jgi:hypothetical protein
MGPKVQWLNRQANGSRFKAIGARCAVLELPVPEQHMPAIRLGVRRWLTDPALRRLLDSMDICPSVLASRAPGFLAPHSPNR